MSPSEKEMNKKEKIKRKTNKNVRMKEWINLKRENEIMKTLKRIRTNKTQKMKEWEK